MDRCLATPHPQNDRRPCSCFALSEVRIARSESMLVLSTRSAECSSASYLFVPQVNGSSSLPGPVRASFHGIRVSVRLATGQAAHPGSSSALRKKCKGSSQAVSLVRRIIAEAVSSVSREAMEYGPRLGPPVGNRSRLASCVMRWGSGCTCPSLPTSRQQQRGGGAGVSLAPQVGRSEHMLVKFSGTFSA